MRVDLHLHTTASDGAWAPARVVRAAHEGRLDLVSITDHDTMAGFDEALAAGVEYGVHVVPGIEVSSTWHSRDIHVLGYFVDPGHSAIRRHMEEAGGRRERRMEEMVDRLVSMGIPVSMAEVEAQAGTDRGNLGRPHLARALVQAGHVPSFQAAFQQWIGDGMPAFVPAGMLDPSGAIAIISASGGIPVWAHPPSDLIDLLLPEMVRAGLRGLEVHRPSHGPSEVARLESLCRSAALLATGGSDWHSPDSGHLPGSFWVASSDLEPFLDAGGI